MGQKSLSNTPEKRAIVNTLPMPGSPRPSKRATATVVDMKDDAREDLKKAAKNFSNEAIATLVEIMRDRNVTATTRMQAASMILDRGHGKAVNQSEVTVGVYDRYSNDDLIKFITGQTKNLIDVTPTKN